MNGEVRSTKGSGDEPWNRDRTVNRSVRPPRLSAPDAQQSYGVEYVPVPVHQPVNTHATPEYNSVLFTSNLNVNAQEFVPRQQPQSHAVEDMNYLAEAIEVLTLNPGRYQEFLPPIEDIVETVIHDKNALGQIIHVIIEQCVIEQNFRYTGARLCRDLAAKFYVTFVNCLLEKCCNRFAQLASMLDSRRDRVLGFGLTLAELYLQITIDGSSRIRALASGINQILAMLLAVPAYDTIRAICQIIKLCGMALESEGVSLEPVFMALEQLGESPAVEENARRVIAGLLHLRRTEWMGSRQVSEPAPPHNPAETYSNEPVFYSPDGQIMSEEERSFLLDNIPISEDLDDYIVDNEMDEEANAAFDEFVSYQKNNHMGHRS